MKGYLLLFLITAALLLLLPLAALPPRPPSEPPSSAQPSTPSEPPAQTADSDEATFRILCGDKVVTLTEREFLLCSLAMEMGPSYHEEALKAQTVATYTYYCRRRQAQRTKADPALAGADFITPSPKFPDAYTAEQLQKNWGDSFEERYAILCEAVDLVKGRTMMRDEEYIDACYFAISNGSTESAETVWGTDIPYLQAVASPGDRLADGYRSVVTLSSDEVRTILKDTAVTLSDDPAKWFGAPTRSEAGTVVSLPVGNVTLSGTEARKLFGLRSASFTVTYAENAFTFSVEGYGHGVGMSQSGADYLAKQGCSWEEILQYYYTDITIR